MCLRKRVILMNNKKQKEKQIQEKIKKIDVTNQVLVFDNKVKINLNDINDIEIWKN